MAGEHNPVEPDGVRTTIVGGRPPRSGVIPRHIPRGLEVLIKKAAVDPAFKNILFEKRAAAAEAIALDLSPTEEAMLAAVPAAQLKAIVANTKVSPGLRPAFLGYAAGVMLAALGATALNRGSAEGYVLTLGITPGTYEPIVVSPKEMDVTAEYGAVKGRVIDTEGAPIPGAVVSMVVLGEEMTAKVSEKGTFLIENVRIGLWTVTAACKGYRTTTKKEIEVRTGYSTYVTFTLAKSTTTPKPSSVKPTIDGIRPDKP
jgi:hypothetical protein